MLLTETTFLKDLQLHEDPGLIRWVVSIIDSQLGFVQVVTISFNCDAGFFCYCVLPDYKPL